MAAGTGVMVLLTGIAGALLRRAAKQQQQRSKGEPRELRPRSRAERRQQREDAEAKARMDGEGGSMQPVAVHCGTPNL